MTIINGKIPLVNLTALSVGGFLQANAAYWFEQWRIAARNAGYDLTITSIADAYREYAVQERIFRQRYTPVYTQYAAGKVDRRLWLNSYWYRKPGYAAAAVPGTSNHGRGLAVDIEDVGGFTSKFYKWLKATGADYGFSNTEGASVNEAWHWVHDGKAIPPKPAPPKPLPNTNTPESPTETKEDPMLILADTSTGYVAALFPNGRWALIKEASSAQALRAASGVGAASVDTVTWHRMCPADTRLHTL